MAEPGSHTVPLKRLIRLLGKEQKVIYAIFFYAALNGVVVLILPLGIQAVLTFLLGGRLTATWMLLVIFIMAALIFAGLMRVAQISLVERLQQRIFAKSSYEISYRIPKFKPESMYRKYAPELINRFFDTLNIQKGVLKILIDFITAALEIVFGLILLSIYHPIFFAYSVSLVLFIYLLFRYTSPRAIRTKLEESTAKYKMAYWLQEVSRNLATFKLAGETLMPQEKVDAIAEEYLTHRQSHFRVLITQFMFMIGFKVITVGVLLIVGSLLLMDDQISIGQFVAAEVIIILLLSSIEKVILSLETIYDTIVGAEKVGAITDVDLESEEGEHCSHDTTKGFEVEFENISFTYPGLKKPTLHDFNLKIEKGSKTVIAGGQGTGKSTVLHLAAGLYSTYSGKIYINDINLNLMNLREYRSYVGDSMSQQTVFNGTLKENITLNRTGISEQDYTRSLELANLTPYIRNLPHGDNEMLLPMGQYIPDEISRKIILARSFCHPSGLLLLESPVIELNREEQEYVLNHIFKLSCTVLAVSTNENVLKRAERIITLENGRISFDGDYAAYKAQNT